MATLLVFAAVNCIVHIYLNNGTLAGNPQNKTKRKIEKKNVQVKSSL